MIYADYNASAPLCKEVVEFLTKRLNTGPFANPNSIHFLGQQVNGAIEKSRRICAEVLGADKDQLFFNSGASEGISTIFHSTLPTKNIKKNLIVISGIEHSAIINTAKFYEKEYGYKVEIIPTTNDGVIDFNYLKSFVQKNNDNIALVSVMAANNESGVIQPYQEISKLCNKNKITYFCDTTQFIGKEVFNFKESEIDFAVLSAHKIGGMTGVGGILAKDPTKLKPLIIGGGQEKGKRSGTQNYLGNETMAVALTTFKENLDKLNLLRKKREEFERKIKADFPNVVILGENAPRVANTTYISLPGIHGQAVQIELEAQGVFITTSSACSDNEPVTSRILKSMNVPDDVGRGATRISLGPCSDLAFYDKIYTSLRSAYEKLSKINSF